MSEIVLYNCALAGGLLFLHKMVTSGSQFKLFMLCTVKCRENLCHVVNGFDAEW